MAKLTKSFKFIRTSILVLSGLLGVSFIGFYIFLFSIDIDSQRGSIERYLSKKLDRELKINGGLELRPSFLSPRLIAKDVTLANAPWSSDPWFVKIERLEGSISLLSLLHSDIEISNVQSQNTKIYLERNAEGKANWSLGEPGSSKNNDRIFPSIISAETNNLELIIKSKDRPLVNLKFQRVTASLPKQAPLLLDLEYNYEDTPVLLKLKGNSLQTLFEDNYRWPFKGNLSLPSLELDVNGTLKNVNNLTELDLKVNATPLQNKNKLVVLGWRYQSSGLIDIKLNLKEKGNGKGMSLDFLAKGKNIDLTRNDNLKNTDSISEVKIGEFQISSNGVGENINDLIQNSSSNYLLKDAALGFQGDKNQKPEQLLIKTLHTIANPTEKIASTLTGNYQNLNFHAHVNHGRIIDLIWSDITWPYNASIDLADSQFVTKGNVTKKVVSGDFQLQGNSIKKTLHYFDLKVPELAEFRLTGDYRYRNNQFNIENIVLNAIDSVVTGDMKYTLAETPLLDVALTTKKPSFSRLLHTVTDYKDTQVDIERLDIKAHSKGNTTKGLIEHLDLSLHSPIVQVNATHNEKSQQNTITIKDIKIDNKSKQSLTASAAVSYRQFPSNVSLRSETIQTLHKKYTSPIKIELKNENSILSFNGKMTGIKPKNKQSPALAGNLRGNIDNLAMLGNSGTLQLPEYKNISLKARLNADNKSFHLSKILLSSNDLNIKGNINYIIEKSLFNIDLLPSRIDISKTFKTYIKQTLPSEQNNKDELFLEDEEEETTQQQVTTPVIPDFELDTAMLRQFNINGKIIKLNTFYKKEPVNQITGQIVLQDGQLNITLSGTSVHGSQSKISLYADGNTEILKTKASLDLDNFDYGNFFKTLEVSNSINGFLDADIDLETFGQTSRDLLVNSEGNLEFVTREGRVPRRILELWGSGFLRIFLPTTWFQEDTTNLNCAVGRFRFEDGYLKSKTLLADTERVTIAGEIALDLSSEELHGIFKSKPKQATLFRIGAPIEVTGTLRNTTARTAGSGVINIGKWLIGLSDPYALILLFGDLGAKEKNPCEALLKQPVPNETLETSE